MNLENKTNVDDTALSIPVFSRVPEETNIIVFKTALRGSRLVAEAGHHIVAERGSTVLAMAGSKVAALSGSKVLTCLGAQISEHSGSKIIVMNSPTCVKNPESSNSCWQKLELDVPIKSESIRQYSQSCFPVEPNVLHGDDSPLEKFFPKYVQRYKSECVQQPQSPGYYESLSQRFKNTFAKNQKTRGAL